MGATLARVAVLALMVGCYASYSDADDASVDQPSGDDSPRDDAAEESTADAFDSSLRCRVAIDVTISPGEDCTTVEIPAGSPTTTVGGSCEHSTGYVIVVHRTARAELCIRTEANADFICRQAVGVAEDPCSCPRHEGARCVRPMGHPPALAECLGTSDVTISYLAWFEGSDRAAVRLEICPFHIDT
jgi:hypothetical protein